MSTAYCHRCAQSVATLPIPGSDHGICAQCGNDVNVAAFDPYHVWLGIPPHEQPPHHYRLLGIVPFESNPEVIEHAAERQIRHLRTCATGPRSAATQPVINAVAAARSCLLDSPRKQAYDAQLRAILAAQSPAIPAPPVPAPAPMLVTPGVVPAVASTTTPAPRPRPHIQASPTAGKSVQREIVKTILGGVAGIGIGLLLLWQFFPEIFGRTRVVRSDAIRNGIAEGVPAEGAAGSTPFSNPQMTPGAVTLPDNPSLLDASSSGDSPNMSPTDATASDTNAPDASSGPVPPAGVKAPEEPAPSSPTTPPLDSSEPSSPGNSPAVPFSSLANSPGAPQLPGQAGPSDLPLTAQRTGLRLPPPETLNWTTLVALPIVPESLTLKADFDRDDGRLQLRGVAGETSEAWNILYRWTPKAGQPAQDTLARFRYQPNSQELQFQWVRADPIAAPALENTFIHLKAAVVEIRYLLRQPTTSPALKLDFQQERQGMQIDVGPQPADSLLWFEVTSLTTLPLAARVRKEDHRVPVGRELVIELEEMPGAEFALKLTRLTASKVSLSLEPRFRENQTRRFDMSLPQLDKAERNITDAQREARAKLSQYESTLSAAQRRVDELRGRTPRNAAEAQLTARELASLTAVIKENTRRAKMAKEQAEEAEARLTNAPRIRTLLRRLQGSVIPFQISTAQGDDSFVLVHGSQ